MENASHLTLQQTFLLTEEKCDRTRGQWPYKPAATRAMRNRHVTLYDLNYLSKYIPGLQTTVEVI